MVLDTIDKITPYNQSEGYEIGDHKLIFKNTYDNEDSGQPKKITINAKNSNAPDFLYYVHIDVDLDRIEDCTCSEFECKCRINEDSLYTGRFYSHNVKT